MLQRLAIFIAPLFIVPLLATACANRQAAVAMSPQAGAKVIEMNASSFKFNPNYIEAYVADALVFRIENISVLQHNFSLKDPEGWVIKNVDLPSKKTTVVKIEFTEAGTYEFYCDKLFHTALGMKGRIKVIPKP